MSRKVVRRDCKNRVLKEGEQQRKDGMYMYTYRDAVTGKRCYIYSWRLEESDRQPAGKKLKPSLRTLVKDLQRKVLLGANAFQTTMTVEQAVTQYLAGKNGVKDSTRKGYKTSVRFFETQPFYKMKIGDINILQAKAIVGDWQNKLGKSYSQIHNYMSVLRPTFSGLVESDLVLKNPFDFKLANVIINDSKKREAISHEDMVTYLRYVKYDPHYRLYYSMIYTLFFTGVRVSELCGITMSDIDFENRSLIINKQLIKDNAGAYRVTSLKGKKYDISRTIKLSDELIECFRDLIENRKTLSKELVVADDKGRLYSGFLLLDKDDTPCVSNNISSRMRDCYDKYERTYKHHIPKVSPHVCRHTFATELYRRGVSLKSAQYLLGHSTPDITARIYVDCDDSTANDEMLEKLVYDVSEDLGITVEELLD